MAIDGSGPPRSRAARRSFPVVRAGAESARQSEGDGPGLITSWPGPFAYALPRPRTLVEELKTMLAHRAIPRPESTIHLGVEDLRLDPTQHA